MAIKPVVANTKNSKLEGRNLAAEGIMVMPACRRALAALAIGQTPSHSWLTKQKTSN